MLSQKPTFSITKDFLNTIDISQGWYLGLAILSRHLLSSITPVSIMVCINKGTSGTCASNTEAQKKKKKKCYTPFRETCLFAETYLLFSAAMNKKTSFASFQYLKHIGGKNIQQTLFLKHIFSNSPSHLSCLSCQKMHQCAVVTVVAWIEYVSEKSLSSYFVFLL